MSEAILPVGQGMGLLVGNHLQPVLEVAEEAIGRDQVVRGFRCGFDLLHGTRHVPEHGLDRALGLLCGTSRVGDFADGGGDRSTTRSDSSQTTRPR